MSLDVNGLHVAGKLPADPFDVKPSNVITIKSAMADAFEAMRARAAKGECLAGVSCGYPEIDKALDGLQRGKVYILGARSGVGKSILGVNVALNVASIGEPVLYHSLEMPAAQIAEWCLFAWSRVVDELRGLGVSSWKFRKGKCDPRDWTMLTASTQAVSAFPFAIDERCALTIEAVEKSIIASPSTLVVIDHILLIAGTNPRQPRREQMIHVTHELKRIAKQHNVAILALTQLNRASEARQVKDKRPRISDLQESGSVEQDADAVILLYREDKYREGGTPDHVMEVLMPKVRGGSEAYKKLHFVGDRYQITNPAGPDADDKEPT